MLLFKCATSTQLINALQIKRTLFKDSIADVILSRITDFSSITEKLKDCGLFRRVIETKDTIQFYQEFRELSQEDRLKMTLHPESVFGSVFELKNEEYTELFLGVPYPDDILLYYYLIKRGNPLKLNFYEEAQTTYLRDWGKRMRDSGISHQKYGNKSILKSEASVYLYKPELYFGTGYADSLVRIPGIECDEETKNLFFSIFEQQEIPKEKYIFFEENYISENNMVMDIDCLDELAKYVGKDNIIVKAHPRSHVKFDRFTPRGYKLMPQSKFPMEMLLFSDDIDQKIFVTISSGSGVSGSVMFKKTIPSINLFRHMIGGKNYHVREPSFNQYFHSLMLDANADCPHIFAPRNTEEFKEVIIYLEGGIINADY